MKRIQKPKPQKKDRGEELPPVPGAASRKRESNRLREQILEELDELEEFIKRGD